MPDTNRKISGKLAELSLGRMENGNGYHKNFAFGEFCLETELETLRRDGAEVHLPKRPYSVLIHLIENRERIVSRDELLEKFWEGHDVYDDALRKCVGAIRTALNDRERAPRFIETRRGSGYHFIGAVAETTGAKAPAAEHTISPTSAPRPHESGNGVSVPAPAGEKAAVPNLLRSRLVLLALLLIGLASLVTLGITAYRRRSRPVPNRTLTEAVAARPSLAILPLKNLTGDGSNDYLSDGVTESLINEVSRIQSLKVVSRGSAFQFKDKETTPQEIGAKLGVDSILEGALQESDGKFRVEVRLVSAKDGSVVWASSFQENSGRDMFAIQDGIVCQLVTELKVKLCGEMAPAARYTKNVKAYQLYLEGLYYRNRLDFEDLQKAEKFFDQALAVDPNYGLAHEGLASVYMLMELNSHVPPGTTAPQAEFHAQKALALDDSLAGAYMVLGAVKTLKNYDLKTREYYYEQALIKDPNYRTAHLWLAVVFMARGDFERAEKEILTVQEVDPLSFGVRVNLGELYYYWGKPDKSIEQVKLMLDMQPNDEGVHDMLARAYVEQGDLDQAFASLVNSSKDDPTRVYALAAAGRKDEALKVAKTYAASDRSRNNPYYAACLFALSGDKESAFAWLERSYAMRQADLISLKIDPALNSLHDDARYQDLLKRINLAAS